MTKTEALKAAIDGEKIRNERMSRAETYMMWDRERFVVSIGGSIIRTPDITSFMLGENWSIVPKTVNFATAWKAYEAGHKIKHASWGSSERLRDGSLITPDDIRGPWLVL